MKEYFDLPIFKDIPLKTVEEMFNSGKIRDFKKGDIVFFEMEKDDTFYLILDGVVGIFVESEGGKEKILSILSKGNFFGEMAILEGKPRSAGVRVLEDARFLILGKKNFLNMITKEPKLSLNVIVEMSRRLRYTDQQIKDLIFRDAVSRLARSILVLSDEFGKKKDGDIVIDFAITHQSIAEITGLARETVSRVFTRFEEENVLKIEKHRITIHGIEKLRRLAVSEVDQE
ncbi:MAG: Crp/Fnr family transcriptional regulator [Thermotogae bacterium]|nr:Crp/Fnr family transcriptional regulator [Thermotogota bacterium]